MILNEFWVWPAFSSSCTMHMSCEANENREPGLACALHDCILGDVLVQGQLWKVQEEAAVERGLILIPEQTRWLTETWHPGRAASADVQLMLELVRGVANLLASPRRWWEGHRLSLSKRRQEPADIAPESCSKKGARAGHSCSIRAQHWPIFLREFLDEFQGSFLSQALLACTHFCSLAPGQPSPESPCAVLHDLAHLWGHVVCPSARARAQGCESMTSNSIVSRPGGSACASMRERESMIRQWLRFAIRIEKPPSDQQFESLCIATLLAVRIEAQKSQVAWLHPAAGWSLRFDIASRKCVTVSTSERKHGLTLTGRCLSLIMTVF